VPVAALVDGQPPREELLDEPVERRDHLAAALDGKRAAGAEVVLHVHDDERPPIFLSRHPINLHRRKPDREGSGTMKYER
jgi:hypothetical protein